MTSYKAIRNGSTVGNGTHKVVRNGTVRHEPAPVDAENTSCFRRTWILFLALVVVVATVIFSQMIYAAKFGSIIQSSFKGDVDIFLNKAYMGSRNVSFGPSFDVHVEDRLNGHVGVVNGSNETHAASHPHTTSAPKFTTVAIGCATTTRGVKLLTRDNFATKLPFFRTLLTTFCTTASNYFSYHFYVSYDYDDPFFKDMEFLKKFYRAFVDHTSRNCPRLSRISLHFVECSHHKAPAWAQNDAMMEAYLDDMDFYFRINDDSNIASTGWTEKCIKVLENYSPKYVGVVGPMHTGGNTAILTHDFVHKTHVDIFGVYYPRLFTDWWADDWVTKVYVPGRSTKLNDFVLKHTLESGTRYSVHWDVGKKLGGQLNEDKKVLDRFIKAKDKYKDVVKDSRKVISMSIWGQSPQYIYGAIRNAQLMQVFYPEWTLRVYIEKKSIISKSENLVAERIVSKLRVLGAQIVEVENTMNVDPKLWRFYALTDTDLDVVIFRDANAHISERDAAVVREWMSTDALFHCVRDHPDHSANEIVPGLWGARTGKYNLTKDSLQKILVSYDRTSDIGQFIYENIIEKDRDKLYCHDSVSCKDHQNSHPLKLTRVEQEFIGQKFDAFNKPVDSEVEKIQGFTFPAECVS